MKVAKALLRKEAEALGVTLVPAVLLLGVLNFQPFVPFELLAGDPLVLARKSPDCCQFYFGALSNLGVLIFTISAGSALLAAAVCFRKDNANRSGEFFLSAATITLLLAVDDLFLMHDDIAVIAGIGEQPVIAVYALLISLFLFRFRDMVLQYGVLFMITALAFFAVSTLLDSLDVIRVMKNRHFLEEGPKFLGIVAWAGFNVRASYFAMTGLTAQNILTPHLK